MPNPVFRFLFMLVTMFCFAYPSWADDIQTFDLTGTFVDGTSASGTLSIDTTLGKVVAADVLYTGDHMVYDIISGQGPFDFASPVSYQLLLRAPTSAVLAFEIEGSFALDSLIAYSGGALCSQTSLSCGEMSVWNTGESTVALQSGSLTIPTPEPGTVLLFGAALFGRGALQRVNKLREP